jgi:hypothetical protein
MKPKIPIAIVTVACIVAVVVVARLSARTAEPTSQAGTSSEETEPRGGDEAREEAEELGQELRLEGGVARVSQVANAPAAGWQGEQVWSATANDWEPAIAVDPSSNWVYEATTRYGGPKACQQCPDPAILVRASSDGGATWGPDRYICNCKNTKAQNDPQLAVATDGTIYASWLNDYNPGVVFSKSNDHGVTWSTPLGVKGKGLSFSDKPILAISPSGQDVYIAWNASDSYMSVSHNGGTSFAARVKTNDDGLYWFAEGGVVAPNGNVFFSESAENQNSTGPVKLAVIRSSPAGTSWTTTFVDTSQQQPPCTVPSCPADFLGSQAAIGVDVNGKLMVAYTLNTVNAAPKDLYVRTSTDAGVTWGARSEIGVNSGDAGFPVIEAGPAANDFRVAWQDDRNGATSWNTWYRRTTDGGSTWSTQVRLSDATSGASYKNANGYAFPYGDYFDLDVTASGTNVVIWGEGTNYVGPGGIWFTRGS